MPPTCHVQSHLPAGSRRPRAAIMPVSTGSRLTDSAQCSPWLTLQFSDAGAQFGKNFIHRPRQRTVERHARRILMRSEEHTSELQSLRHLVCRLLLEKKKNKR